jgi:NAD(P)-dependent dehydrogenase (short-subunit alcohol dehydrogenase family)
MDSNRNGKSGRIAWIVGVGSVQGAGAAIAKRFAQRGFTVVVTGRSPDRLARVVEHIEASGAKALAAPGDATREDQLLDILNRIEGLGSLDVGIYNAGNAVWGPTLELNNAVFEDAWRVCCLGGFMFAREVAKSMLRRGHGTILFTGATASLRGKPQFAAFASAKAGLRMVSQSLARELQPQGIHIAHVVIDGSIEGEKIRKALPDYAMKKGPDGLLDLDAIADSFWYLHQQHRSAWSHEIDLRPYVEAF